MNKVKIRPVRLSDAKRLSEIYAPYVKETAITFEIEAPDAKEFERRIKKTVKSYPYLVAENDDGVVVGYAYASAFHERAAFSISAEISVYTDGAFRHQGLGRRLLTELERQMKAAGIQNSNSAIAVPVNDIPDEYLDCNSWQFHEHMGYKEAGRFHCVAKKFGRYYDLLWMEKWLCERDESQK